MMHRAEAKTIAVFTKSTTNPAYAAFRSASDQVARASGVRTLHFVPRKSDDVDEPFVEQVLVDRQARPGVLALADRLFALDRGAVIHPRAPAPEHDPADRTSRPVSLTRSRRLLPVPASEAPAPFRGCDNPLR